MNRILHLLKKQLQLRTKLMILKLPLLVLSTIRKSFWFLLLYSFKWLYCKTCPKFAQNKFGIIPSVNFVGLFGDHSTRRTNKHILSVIQNHWKMNKLVHKCLKDAQISGSCFRKLVYLKRFKKPRLTGVSSISFFELLMCSL